MYNMLPSESQELIEFKEKLRKIIDPFLADVLRRRNDLEALSDHFHQTLLSAASEEEFRMLLGSFSRTVPEYLQKQETAQRCADAIIAALPRQLPSRKFSLQNLQCIISVFIGAYLEQVAQFYAIDPVNDICGEDIYQLQLMVTAAYLETWLAQDTLAQKTIYDFASSSYQVGATKLDKNSAVSSDARRLARASERWKDVQALIHNQAVRENLEAGAEIPLASQPNPGKACYLDPIALAYCDLSPDFPELLLSRHFANRRSGTDSNQNIALADKYAVYQASILSIKHAYQNLHKPAPLGKAPLPSEKAAMAAYSNGVRKCVASCMLSLRLELSCRFQLVNQLVHYCLKTQAEPIPLAKLLEMPCWNRYILTNETLFDRRRYAGDSLVRSSEPYDIFGYAEKIQRSYQAKFCRTDQQEQLKVLFKRAAFVDCLTFLNAAFPHSSMPSWSLEDYEAAASFYIYQFRLVDLLTENPPFFFLGVKSELQKKRSQRQKQQMSETERSAYEKAHVDEIHQYYDLYHQIFCGLYHSENTHLAEDRKDLENRRMLRKLAK